jgi:ABC-2 type transport system ATP-binding protein
MLTVDGVTKRYGKRVAVDGVSFQVAPGEVVALLGPNGAGKTTTMRMIAGVLEPDLGRIAVLGADIENQRRRAQATMGYLPEGAPLHLEMTAREHLMFLGHARGMSGSALGAAVLATAEQANVAPRLDETMATLSKGWRRRVAFAGAMLHDPAVLILDEPTDGLDPIQKMAMRTLLQDLKARHKAVLVSTHALDEVTARAAPSVPEEGMTEPVVSAVFDRVVVIGSGRVLADETPADLAARSGGDIEAAFAALIARGPVEPIPLEDEFDA